MSTIHSPGIKNVNEDIAGATSTAPPFAQTIPVNSGLLVFRQVNEQITVNGLQSMGIPANYLIPAGHATGIAAGSLSELNIQGAPFTDAHDMLLKFDGHDGRTSGELLDLGLRDNTAPTVISVHAQVDPADQLLINFSKPEYAPDLSSLSLSYSVGTHRTMTGIVSGNGTSQLVVQLSGPIARGDALLLVVAADSNIVSVYPGLALVAGSTSVSVPSEFKDLPNCVLQWNALSASEVTLSGSNVLTMVDRSAIANVIHAGAHDPTWIADTGSGTPAVQFADSSSDGTLAQTMKIDATPLDATLDFTVILLANEQAETGSYNGWWVNEFTGSGAKPALISAGGVLQIDVNATILASLASSLNAWKLIMFGKHGTKWWISVDLSTPSEVDYTTNQPAGNTSMELGRAFFDAMDTTIRGLNAKIKTYGVVQSSLPFTSSTVRQYIRDVTHTHFPTDCP
jgi:hypothetical protein